MNKLLFFLLLFFPFTYGTLAQGNLGYSDNKLDVKVTVEQMKDVKNDRFHQYYALTITNKTSQKVSFSPVLIYKTDKGEVKNSTQRNNVPVYTLAPGETLHGDWDKMRDLTLFKEFMVGNSGKKASNGIVELQSVSVEYFTN